jgi:hypothetical protein
LERITNKKLVQDLLSILNLQRGVPYTIWEVIKNPGKTIRTYLYEDRRRYVNSFRTLSIMVAISTFILYQIDFFDGAEFDYTVQSDNPSQAELQKKASSMVASLLKEYLSWFNFLMVPFIGAFTYLFFKSSGYNFAEHTTAQAYLLSATTAISLMVLPTMMYSKNIYLGISLIVTLVFQIRFCMSLPSKSGKGARLVKSLASYILAYMLYSFLMMFIVGIIIGYRIAKGTI